MDEGVLIHQFNLNPNWLFLPVPLLIANLLFVRKTIISKRHKVKFNLMPQINFIVHAILLSWYLKVFIIGVARVPSNSMENTITSNNWIIFQKLIAVRKYHFKILGEQYQINLSSNASIENDDLLVFDNPINGQLNIKRCIGKPGDTLVIKDQLIWINDIPRIEPKGVKYKIFFIDDYTQQISEKLKLSKSAMANLKLSNVPKSVVVDYYQLSLLKESKDLFISSQPYIFRDSVIIQYNKKSIINDTIFLPSKNYNIDLNEKLINKYKELIPDFDFYFYKEEINQNSLIPDNYKFQNNYFYVLGDNRSNSFDSRKWGLLRDTNIRGKVIYIIK